MANDEDDREPDVFTRCAMNNPMTRVSGAATIMVHTMTTSFWTCCTSLVIRVMSDGAPNWPTSRAEKAVT